MMPLFTRRRAAALIAAAPWPHAGGARPPRRATRPIVARSPGLLPEIGASNLSATNGAIRCETLEFWGIEPDMTVLEILPGLGWYTAILAPYLAEGGGRLIVASFDPVNGICGAA